VLAHVAEGHHGAENNSLDRDLIRAALHAGGLVSLCPTTMKTIAFAAATLAALTTTAPAQSPALRTK
ncbi:MAG: hypothetical protein WBL96_14420, partial [Pseudolabrys sp.]